MLGSSFPEEPALLRVGALGAAASPTTSSLGRVMLTSLGALPEAHDGLAEIWSPRATMACVQPFLWPLQSQGQSRANMQK